MKNPRDGGKDRELAAFRERQEEMVQLSREFSEARLYAWAREIQEMAESWEGFQQDWQGALSQMRSAALTTFEEIAGKGEATGYLLSQSWEKALAAMTEEVESWAQVVVRALGQVNQAWPGQGGQGAGNDWLSWLGVGFDFGGWFHKGGIVEAHRGMVVSPETLLGEEQTVVVQTGEGILPRDSMLRLGKDNFEALRTGQFEFNDGARASSMNINIHVQALDAAGVAGMDWNRLVSRHLLPALQKELGRRW